MDKSKEKIIQIINTIAETFPDDNDLKGFAGISRALILDLLDTCKNLIIALTYHSNAFETIVLKRELAELFDKLDRDLEEKYEKIKPGQFNSFLRHISRIKFLIKETYISVIEGPPIRTESEIAMAKETLNTVVAQTSDLKNASFALIEISESTKSSISKLETEIRANIEAAETGAKNAQDEVSKLKDSVLANINASHEEIEKKEKAAETIIKEIEENKKLVEKHLTEVAQASVVIDASKSSIEEIAKSVETWQQEISVCKDDISKYVLDYNALTLKGKVLLDDSESTHRKIFGEKGPDGSLVNGYFQQTEELKNELEHFLSEQKSKYLAQFNEIEGLLPGATSAGLAEAYQVQKKSYGRPIMIWSTTFIIAVSAMAILSAILLYLQLKNPTTQNLSEAFIGLLKDLPFFIPTLWLASYASKQQSQYKRLQQEYAFKETNAKSFHGHKMQIEALMKDGIADKDLLLQLLAQLVVITSQNPSETLDNKAHEDNSPILKLVEKVFPSILKKIDKSDRETKTGSEE